MHAVQASKIITDEYSAKILVCTLRRPRTALEISRDYGIPIAACYRRIRMLEKLGLLRCVERRLTSEGKRIAVYSSMLKGAYIYLENGVLKARFELMDGKAEDYSVEWDKALRV